MNKVKVTQAQMDVVKKLLSTSLEFDEGKDRPWGREELLKEHSDYDGIWKESFEPLNGVPVRSLAAMLYFPEMVEVEKTPEEELLNYYNSINGTERLSVRITLEKLKIKVKGINE